MKTSMTMAAALSAAACPAFAADPPIHRTAPVVVTATRFEQPRAEAPIGLTVIDREAIEKSTATSVVELLSRQAGIQTRDSTGSPDRQVDLRGFGQTGDLNTAVLVDGQRYNEIDTSPVKWSSIPLEAVERIEILRGSGAVLYGSGATGGVINIITRQPRAGERSATVRAGAGSYGTTDAQAAFTVAGDRVGMRVNASDLRSDNYRDNNRITQRNVLADVRTLGRDHVYAKLGIDRQDLRNPGQLTLAELARDRRGTSTPLDFSSRDAARINVGGVLRVGDAELAANLAYRKQEAEAFFSAFSSRVNNDTESIAFSPRFRLPHSLLGLRHTLVGGIDVEQGELDRSVTGTFFSGRSRSEQDRQGVYLQDDVALTERLRLTLGARAQRAETTLEDPATSPAPLAKTHHVNAAELALRYQASPAFALYGKAGRSFRLPSVEELNFTGPAILEPQTSRDLEAGVVYSGARLRTRISVYRYNLENEIAFNPLAGAFGDNVNLAPTRRAGVEIESTLRLTEALEAFANFAHVDARFRSGVYGGTDVTDNRVPLVPRNALTVGGAWRAAARTTVSASAQYVGRQRFLNDEANTLAAQIPGYTVVDVKIARLAGGWRLEAGVSNLLGEKYYTQGGLSGAGVIRVFPAPERSFYATASYAFR